MFEEYKKELLAFYFSKKQVHPLSDNLENPRRSKLRKECLNIFVKKHTKEDREIIKAFFDPAGKFNDPVRSIEKVVLDDFRPLVNFLKNGTNIRDEEPVKLLAWLIDFDSYQEWRLKQETEQSGGTEEKYPLDNDKPDGKDLPGDDESGYNNGKGLPGEDKPDDPDGKDLSGYDEPGNNNNGKGLPGEDKPDDPDGKDLPGDDEQRFLQKIPDIITKRPFSIKNAAMGFITLLVLAVGVFFLVENTTDTIRQPLADEKCMYWTGSHYEPVKCDEKIKNATIIPINLRVLNNLKRINVTDTLTSYSLGKVWYLNIRRKPEFFTDSGMHPVETSRKLKPLSKHILSNHVSYYRYLLIHLIWLICVIITFVLFMVCLMFFLKRKKKI